MEWWRRSQLSHWLSRRRGSSLPRPKSNTTRDKPARALTARSRCQTILCRLVPMAQANANAALTPVFLHSCLLSLSPVSCLCLLPLSPVSCLLSPASTSCLCLCSCIPGHSPTCPPTANCLCPLPLPKPRPPRYFSLCLLTLGFTCSRQGRRTVVVCSYFHILAAPLSGRSLARCCDF